MPKCANISVMYFSPITVKRPVNLRKNKERQNNKPDKKDKIFIIRNLYRIYYDLYNL